MGQISYIKGKDIAMQTLAPGYARGEMLPGQMEGVTTYRCLLKAGTKVYPERLADAYQVFFFCRGTGYLVTDSAAFVVESQALFAPKMEKERYYFLAESDMEYLQLIASMNQADKERYQKYHAYLPFFSPSKSWVRYVEGFRGEELKTYSALKWGDLGTVTMGVVRGPGDARVEPHSHDMVYQWFYALEGSSFRFAAGEEEIGVEEGDWLCIQNRVPHVVKAEPKDLVHYVWYEVAAPELR